ncbi:MAG TPA: DUF389 domain-containing protein [Actinomycetota bacterium]|nr:DUF389 domain-containing protein [Actinomycetota bacterium]
MLSLTLLVPPSRSQSVIDVLTALDGVHTVVRVPAAAVESGDDLLAAAVEPGVADLVLERLAAAGVPGERVTLSQRGIDVTEIGRPAEGDLWDEAADVVVWEEVLESAAEDSRLSLTYLVTMAIAGFIASIGVYDDQPVLIVGAMALSPDLAHLSALSVGLVCRRPGIAGRAAATLLAGLGVAAAVGAATVAIASEIGYAPQGGGFGRGVLTSFITNPGLAGAAVALAGGVAAMLSFERRSAGAAVGVAISVTTIPAAAGLGVAIGLADLDRALGALAVLAINLSCLTAGAVATAAIQRRRRPAVPADERLSSRRRGARVPSHRR